MLRPYATFILIAAVGGLSACGAPRQVARDEPPVAFHDTLVQYAVLTNDRTALQQDFQMNPERSGIERVVAGAQLPFSAAIETLVWPVAYGLPNYLAEPSQ
ncbi:hypothetical protein [Methylococcus sp. EFPC2]|uniref:hypothetical protein n=1 Tax=Methylococcus sp. EFPC2 TaxID=2812648 RepID=UPI0019674032|nr:hypothetical protein [Methylococcus sp. EFPC2]QSA97938.1 hypothetical protein JWZ97_03670 [Methylococcus sp. EFPC2]